MVIAEKVLSKSMVVIDTNLKLMGSDMEAIDPL